MTILSGNYKTKLTTFVLFNPTLLKRTLIPILQPPPSDAEILTELLETEGDSDDDDDYSGEVADEPVKCPDKNELL